MSDQAPGGPARCFTVAGYRFCYHDYRSDRRWGVWRDGAGADRHHNPVAAWRALRAWNRMLQRAARQRSMANHPAGRQR